MKGYSRLLLLLGLLALCVLTSCQTQPAPQEDPHAIRLYFLDSQSSIGSAIASEPYTGTKTATVRILVNALLSGPTREGLSSPFPAYTSLRGWSVEEGLLTLDLSEHYGDLSGIDLTLADYCIALTLCQLEGVDQVRITVAGSPLAYRGHEILDPSEVMLDGLLAFQSEEAGRNEAGAERLPGEDLSGEGTGEDAGSGRVASEEKSYAAS